MAYYLVAFQGSNAFGGLGFGAIAQGASLSTALLVVCGCLAVGVLATWQLAFPAAAPTDMQPGEPWPLPELDATDSESGGPVLVTVKWSVRADQTDAFLELAGQLRALGRRTGATSWRLYRPAGNEHEFFETYVVGSWAEHERQPARIYPPDQALLAQLDATLEPGHPREVTHYLAQSTRSRQTRTRSRSH